MAQSKPNLKPLWPTQRKDERRRRKKAMTSSKMPKTVPRFRLEVDAASILRVNIVNIWIYK
jgi:hypothetical protein